MSLSSWLLGASQVDEAIDKATSELLPAGTEDIALNLEICDQIRSKSVQPKDAMRALKRRLNHKNPNVQLLALSLTDTCIKNGGDHFLVEVSSREFMDNLVSILKMPSLNLDVKNKVLKHIQNWALIFEGKPNLPYVGQVYSTLKSEGFSFPPQDRSATSSAMAVTQMAPEWIDSDVCLRCRTPFSLTNRKHHCRNCGQVFDHQCSSKSLPLPHFGIAQEVRVCDACHSKLTKKDIKVIRHSSSSRHRSGRELADEELQRAIQLSLQEVGAANVNGHSHRPGYTPSYSAPAQGNAWHASEPPLVDKSTRPSTVDEEENDPELRAAIEASLREASAPKPSAPVGVLETSHRTSSREPPARSQTYPAVPNYELEPLESDAILTFSQTVEHVEAQGGRDISRFPAVNELYDKASGLRPKLAMSLDDTSRKEKALTDMHEKLSQAVKLYDSLLTQQLTRPTWRSNSHQTEPNRHNTVDGSYQQWSQASSGGPSQMPQTQAQNNWSQTAASAYPQQPMTYPAQYAQPLPADQVYHPAQQVASQQTGSSVNTSYQPTHQQLYTTPSLPAQYAPAQIQSPPPSIQQNTPYMPQQNIAYQTSAAPVSVPSPPAPSQAQAQPIPPPPNSQFAPPSVPQIPSPPLAQYQQSASVASPPPQPILSRQNTLSYSSTAIGYGTPVSPPQGIPIQARPQSQPMTTPAPLPHFPAVPTSNFAPFPIHGSSVSSSGFEQSEQQEALLIDL